MFKLLFALCLCVPASCSSAGSQTKLTVTLNNITDFSQFQHGWNGQV